MEKSNFTFNYSIKHVLSTCVLLLLGLTSIHAQCSLGVNSSTQISLDEDCQAEVTPEIILNDQTTTCPDGVFIVNVQTLDEVNIPTSPIVTSDYIDQQLIAEVVDLTSGNTGWGYIFIEDKLAPTIICSDVTVSCTNIQDYEPEVIDGCDPNPTITLLSQSTTDLPCDDDFIEVITQTFQATDASGNVSAICSQDIYVERIELDDVIFPTDLTQANGDAIACDEIVPLDDNGNPHPSFTGVPTLYGDDLFPTSDLSCNAVVTYTDVVLPSIGGVQKIMREWIVNEWFCNSSNTVTDIQVIEIVDAEGPVFETCPDNLNVSTTAGTDCEAIVLLQVPTVSDECGTVLRVDLATTNFFESDFTGGLISLPIGINTVTYTAYDNNNNSSECEYIINVEDNTAPVVVCDQNTIVSLTLDGTAFVYAQSFDDGSYDDCGDVTYLVKRMDNGNGCGVFDNTFSETVEFCCADIGNEVMVILRVEDENGNFNECMVNVEVQDKLPPAIVCPDNMTVDCDTPFDPDNLSDAFGPGATASDNCNVTMTESSSINIDNCGEGFIIRTFTATDPNGSAQCSQIITFVNNEPFDENDIIFPADITLSDCIDPSSLDPSNTGGLPIISEDACDQVGIDYDDKVFSIVNGDDACFKILRTFEVLDWCNENADGSFVVFTDVQVIKVINTVPPVFTGEYDDVSVCTFDDDCENGSITLTAQAEDACTDELIYSYRIDAFNDGSFDIISNTVIGTSIDASGTYPLGMHRIVYTAEDGCGNSVSQTQFFSIVNCKQPTPYCLNGLAIELMPQDTDGDGEEDFGMIDIWANDFDAGSFHACDFPVTVSFSEDPLDTGRVYTCADLGDNLVEIWAHATLPNGEILSDFCTATLDIQANNGICDDIGPGMLVVVEGEVKTELNEKSNEVNINLSGGELHTMTDNLGEYAFPAMPTGGAYIIEPSKNGDALNGISTADIILIQKHILGLNQLDSPYKIIAADVNKDEKIAGNDIINIRKLLLGYYDEYPNNDSWRFVDAGYQFIDATNPLVENFDETYEINELSTDMVVDFVSVKVGDVNNTALVNAKSEDATTRTNEELTLVVDNQMYLANSTVSVPFKVSEMIDMYGAQFTLKYNTNELEYSNTISGAFTALENSNVGLINAENGLLTISVSDANLTSLNENDELFTIEFTALNDGQLNRNISITSDATIAEAYNTNLEVMEINLEMRNDEGETISTYPFEVFQNVPNPFAQSTTVRFNLPTSNLVTISVFDVTGKKLYSTSNTYAKGMNTVVLDVNSFDSNGILYYQVETNEYSATRKMVVLK